MKIILSFLLLLSFLNAGVLDFWHIKKADKAYHDKNYKDAIVEYKKLDSDEAKYNLANSYYKNGDFNNSIELYKSIKDKELEFQKLHNLGNAYANSNQIPKAIKAYEDALKIKKDKDTKYNLELLKKKQKQQKKQNKNNKKNDKKQKNKKDNNNKQQNQDKKKNKNQKDKDSKDKKNDKKDSKKKQENKKQKNKSFTKPKKQPLSDMQERKYLKMLNKRGVNTLMIPLNKKQKGANHEENPW